MRRKYVPLPSQATLISLLHYSPETGIFTRAVDRRRWKAGQQVGSISNDGYVNIGLNHQIYRAHRLAWLYMTGTEPVNGIDHINRDRSDNRWVNLRASDQSTNTLNRGAQKNSKSGLKGVHKIKKTGRYRAVVTAFGRRVNVGVFATPEEAKKAHDAVSKALHGEFFCS